MLVWQPDNNIPGTPSPLICLLRASSFFRPQQECLCGTLLICPGQSPFLSCSHCTVDRLLNVHVLHCVCTVCLYQSSLYFWRKETESHFSLFHCAKNNAKRKKFNEYFLKNYYQNTLAVCTLYREMHSKMLENLFYKQTFEAQHFLKLGITCTVLYALKALPMVG